MENNCKTHLFRGKICGTNSKDVYKKYAEIFYWDASQTSQFGAQGQPLYAREATPEGYSVWCIAYSNLNAKKGGKWVNHISDDKEIIEELWENRTYDYLHDYKETTTRIAFAKNKEGKYEFLGVYKCEPLPKEAKMVEWYDAFGFVKTYRCISKCYPLKG